MDKSDKLTDMVHEDEDVRKSVEKRRDFPDIVEIVENAQTIIVTNETKGGKALYLANNKEGEIGMEKDTRYGEDAYRIRHGVGDIIKTGIKRKRGRKPGKTKTRTKLTRPKQAVKLPPTPCGICGRNLNRSKSVPCKECNKYVHLHEKCSGLKSQKQYKLDYRCPRCSNNGDAVELNNHPKEQTESLKTAEINRKTTEKEGLPEKVSLMKKTNKIGEKDPSESKPAEGEEKRKMIIPNQKNETLTTIHGIRISKEDRMSLENGKHVTCTIISLYIKESENCNKEILEKNKILMIQPAMVQLLQLGEGTYVKETKKHLNLAKYGWIFFPISNRENPDEGDGGKHFSLLIFSKREHRFFHFDPVKGVNRRYALDLMTNLMDSESVNGEGNLYKLPDFEEVQCAQQQNVFDCGLFVMGYMKEAIGKINNGDTPRNLNPPEPSGALGLRIEIAKSIDGNIITIPKHNRKTDSSSDKEEKPNNNEIVMEADESMEVTCERLDKLLNEEIEKPAQKNNKNDGIGSAERKDNNKTIDKIVNIKDNKEKQEEIKTTNINNNKDNRERQDRNLSSKKKGRDCRYYMNDSCRYGSLCRYTHREVCRGWKINGKCGKGNCTFDHPEPCMNHLKGSCQRRSCWYLHTLEWADPEPDVQQKVPTSMQNQQNHNATGRNKNQKQNFWNGPNRGQEIQKKKTPEEEEKTTTQQQSIDLMMGAMETLKKGLELILMQTKKH